MEYPDSFGKDRVIYSRIKAEFFAKHTDVYVTPAHFFVTNHFTHELQERIPFPYNDEEMEGFK